MAVDFITAGANSHHQIWMEIFALFKHLIHAEFFVINKATICIRFYLWKFASTLIRFWSVEKNNSRHFVTISSVISLTTGRHYTVFWTLFILWSILINGVVNKEETCRADSTSCERRNGYVCHKIAADFFYTSDRHFLITTEANFHVKNFNRTFCFIFAHSCKISLKDRVKFSIRFNWWKLDQVL